MKVLLDELEEAFSGSDDSALRAKIRDVEGVISGATQRFPGEQFIREAESRFAALIGMHERSLVALTKAFEANPRTPFVAIRLAKVHEAHGDRAKAIDVLKRSLDFNPGDKDLNFRLATLLSSDGEITADVIHHLRRSFTRGDSRHDAQFAFARALYLDGKREDAAREFRELGSASVPPAVRDHPRGFVERNGIRARFSGTVARIEANFLFVHEEATNQRIFSSRRESVASTFDQLSWGEAVSFELAFNFRGPVACNVERRSISTG
jgi:tetratricopeptide (TPR) repeat protein